MKRSLPPLPLTDKVTFLYTKENLGGILTDYFASNRQFDISQTTPELKSNYALRVTLPL